MAESYILHIQIYPRFQSVSIRNHPKLQVPTFKSCGLSAPEQHELKPFMVGVLALWVCYPAVGLAFPVPLCIETMAVDGTNCTYKALCLREVGIAKGLG